MEDLDHVRLTILEGCALGHVRIAEELARAGNGAGAAHEAARALACLAHKGHAVARLGVRRLMTTRALEAALDRRANPGEEARHG